MGAFGEALEEAAGGAEGVGLGGDLGQGVGEVGRDGLVGREGGVEGLAEGEKDFTELGREAGWAVALGEAREVGELRFLLGAPGGGFFGAVAGDGRSAMVSACGGVLSLAHDAPRKGSHRPDGARDPA